MLNLSDSLFVGPLLFLFVHSVALGKGRLTVTLRKWVEHPHVKECALSSTSPKTVSYNVEAGAIIPVRSAVVKWLI